MSGMPSKKVLLFSGGLDSYIIAHLEPFVDLLLYVDLGIPAQADETLRIGEMRRSGLMPSIPFVIDGRLQLGDQLLGNGIVPMRNLFLVCIGMYYGNNIVMGSTSGDFSRDADEVFAELLEATLVHVMSQPEDNPPSFAGGTNVSVKVPYRWNTKAELVGMYLEAGHNPAGLLLATSCSSHSRGRQCGHCFGCVRKYVALTINRIPCSHVFACDPRDRLDATLAHAVSRRKGKEIDEIRIVKEMVSC